MEEQHPSKLLESEHSSSKSFESELRSLIIHHKVDAVEALAAVMSVHCATIRIYKHFGHAIFKFGAEKQANISIKTKGRENLTANEIMDALKK